MTRLYHEIEDTVYFCASAAPVLSPTPSLLTDAGYPAGCYEVAVAATAANGFAADSTYAVFCTLAIDSQNPTGYIGSFTLSPVLSNPWDEPKGDHTTWGSFGHVMQGLVPIVGRVNDTGATDQSFDTDGFTEATASHFNGSVLVFTSGNLLGQVRIIETYSSTNQNIFLGRALTEAPANNDEFIILGPITASQDRTMLVDTAGRAQVNVERWQSSSPNTLVSGRVDVSVGAMANDVVTAAAVANAAIDAATFAAGAIDANALATDAANEIADAVLSRDVDQVETTMALHSLGTAILKAVSRIRDNAGTLETYRTNGTTLHMSQTITTDAANDPIDELTAGV
jgi:hypothetical protein